MRELLTTKSLCRAALLAATVSLTALIGAPASASTEIPKHAFHGASDGGDTWTNLIDVNGTLYGTTSDGGAHGLGTVFKMTASGVEFVLHDFAGGADGEHPRSGLTLVGGVLYGTTVGGGSGTGCASYVYGSCGTVFQLPVTTGVESVLYNFQGSADGGNPVGNLLAVGGVLYGTTLQGGDPTCSTTYPSCGTVYSLTTDISPVHSVIHNFRGVAFGDGANSLTGLTSVGGALYGVTGYGGVSANCALVNIGCGTVFKLKPTISGWAENVIAKFHTTDGAIPYGQLTELGGKLYGTTFYGGPHYSGTVFSVATSPIHTFTDIYHFTGGADGSHPYATLTNRFGILYGTTSDGGTPGCGYYNNFPGCGTIFQLDTSNNVVTPLYSFAGGVDGGSPNPGGGLLKRGNWLWGTTLGGGAHNHGTVFKFLP